MKLKKLKFLFIRICYEKIYVNAGVRAVFGQKHGVDFYARFGFLTQSKEYDNMIKGKSLNPISSAFAILIPFENGEFYFV